MPDKDWKGSTQGTTWMHRALMGMFKFLPLRLVYLVAEIFVIPFYLIFSHKGYIAMYHYFHGIWHQPWWKAFWHVYQNHCYFCQVVLDRFYMYAGGEFELQVDDYDKYQKLEEGESGFVILSAHVGCYEAAGYTLTAHNKTFNALVYAGETETVMQNRKRIFDIHHINMIPIREDMSHIFAMSNALSDGDIVSIPGDRIFGSPRHISCDFLGRKADFPLGPFALAVQRDVPVIAVNVMKVKPLKYKVYIENLYPEGKNIREKASSLAHQYVANLEKTIREYPLQWYNYYEFWNESE